MTIWRAEELTRSNSTILVIYKDGQSIGSLSLAEEEDVKLWKRLVGQANLTQDSRKKEQTRDD